MAEQTTIAEFLIGLGFKIDPAQQSRFVDSLKQSHDHIERLGKGMSSILDQFATLATAATGTAIGLAGALARIGTEIAKVGYASERIGSTPANINSLEYALKQVGGSAGEARSALENLANLTRSNPGLLQSYFGIKPGTDPAEALLQLGEHFQKLIAKGPVGMQQATQEAQQVLHMDQPTMLHLADPQTRQFFSQEQAAQRAHGIGTKALADLAIETDRQLNLLQQQYKNFSEFLHKEWGPRVNAGLSIMTTWITTHTPEIDDYLHRMRVHFDELATGISKSVGGLSPEAKSWLIDLGIIGGGAVALRSASGIMGRIGGLIGVPGLGKATGLLGLGFALTALVNDYQTWKETEGKSGLIDWARWEPTIKSASEAVDNFNKNIINPLAEKLGVDTTFIPAFEGLAAFLAVSFLPRIAKVLKALALIPGSGVTIGALAALGITYEVNESANESMYDKAKKLGFEKQGGSWWNPLDKIPTFKNPATGETLSYAQMRERLGLGPGEDENPIRKMWKERPSWLGGEPRGIRNNNPLNLTGAGTAGLDERFGIYNTMEEGIGAAKRQLERYQDVYGLDTIAGIINRWAPPSENDTRGYAARVAKALGVGINDKINTHDPDTMRKLVAAMGQVETGKQLDPTAIQRAIPSRIAMPKLGQMDPSVLQGLDLNSRLLGEAKLAPSPSVMNSYTTSDASQTIHAPVNNSVTINGVGDPQRAADLVNRSLDRQNANMIRNLKPLIA